MDDSEVERIVDDFYRHPSADRGRLLDMAVEYVRRVMAEEEREHIASMSCWCQPIALAYGDELVYDDDGQLVAITRDDESD